MKHIRIYYECLEQAENYIKPIIEKVIDKKMVEIVLVKRAKTAQDLNDGSISALQTMTTPDVLITGIVNDKEYPLILIEFTEAVTTEDHELQRTYGAVAAYLSGAYYLKLSGEKYSEKEFGGANYNPFSTPKIFIEEVGYEGYIIADWKTRKDNKYTLQRNAKYPSCPPDIAILTATLQNAVSAFVQSEKNWFSKSLAELKKDKSYQIYRKQVDSATGAKELLEAWKNRRSDNLNKLRYFVKPDFVAAKINRFSHAMDPDRGILTFISFLFSETRQVFGIYALVRPRGNELMKQDMTTLDLLREKLKTALEMDKGGMPDWLIDEFKTVAKNAKSLNEVIDFQPVWEKHKNKITNNKVVMTLAYFLDGIYLNHNGICLKWDKRKLVNSTNKNFLPAFSAYFGFSNYTKPTPIIEVANEVDEDEVTYTIVHKILIPNGFQIVSVSYPGSQGGGAVLPNPELGKAQPREYPDVIALPPAHSKIDVILNESKGMFAKSSVEKDLEKILRYKTDEKLKTALKKTLLVAQVIDENKQLKNIVIGVAFGIKNNTTTDWQPDNVDFIFRITNRNEWAIGIFKQEMSDLIKKIEGKTNFPTVYKLYKEKEMQLKFEL
ncbi:MAG: hypothetical protein LBE36_00880 [Flavobacteriaceae bacterium]|jgi:hypothetical protein|nr:hypothetical protein [Flavobacteriaceae bacterium]